MRRALEFLAHIALLTLLAVVIFPSPVQAADGSGVSLAPLAEPLIYAATGLISLLASRLILKIDKWLGLQSDSAVRSYLLDATRAGIALAEQQAIKRAGALGSVTVDVGSAKIADVAEYLIQRVPDALAHFKLSGAGLETFVGAQLAQGGPPKLDTLPPPRSPG